MSPQWEQSWQFRQTDMKLMGACRDYANVYKNGISRAQRAHGSILYKDKLVNVAPRIIYEGPMNKNVKARSTHRTPRRILSELEIWHFWVIGIERNVCRCTFNRYSVITQFAKLAAGEQLCRRCTHRKLQHFKTFKSFSRKITDFEMWHCYSKGAI